MIYILLGNDIKKKNTYLKKLYKNDVPIFIPHTDISKEFLFNQARSISLFGEHSIIVLDNAIKEGRLDFSVDELRSLKDSETTFILQEEKLLVSDLKKYKKYATIEDFSNLITKKVPKIDVFNIAEAFARWDKIGAWVLYRQAISQGIPPEEISGILFWKIKMMILNGTKIFKLDTLKKMSSELVAIYHKSHKGEIDFTISLEQFILSSLSKN